MIISNLENNIWHPRNCIINMKTNTRYVYSIFVSVIGIWSLKYLYYYLVKRNELYLYLRDYMSIGSLSGMFTFFILYGFRYRYLLNGILIGGLYGFVYNKLIIYFSKVKQNRAEKIGIKL